MARIPDSIMWSKGNAHIYYESDKCLKVVMCSGDVDYPVYSEYKRHWTIGYDFPERVPAYIKNQVRRIFSQFRKEREKQMT